TAPGEEEKMVDALGEFFKDRYGGIENVKRTLATDPVGFASDLSIFLTGGGSVAAKAPGVAGQAAKIVGTVGRTIDPLSVGIKAVQGAGHVASEVVGGIGTGTGGQSLRTAAKAGAEGGPAATEFTENVEG